MGPVSRAQIARDSDLSKPTVSQALAALLAAGLVREAGRSSGGRGPAAVLYELNPRAGWVVGLDVGRDFVRAAIANLAGEIVARRDERARVRSQRTLIAQIGEISHALAAEAGVKWKQVTFATVGSPGVFDPVTGHVALAHALPGWGRSGLAQAVQDELGTKVAFENDVNLAALGEQWHGLGKGVENFVYLHVGTGVGAGLILRGELYRGHTGAAGEVGYLPIGGDPRDKGLRRGGSWTRRPALRAWSPPRAGSAWSRRCRRGRSSRPRVGATGSLGRWSRSRPIGSRSRPPRSCRSSTPSWWCWAAGSAATATCCSSR